jgi:hypothetical protein
VRARADKFYVAAVPHHFTYAAEIVKYYVKMACMKVYWVFYNLQIAPKWIARSYPSDERVNNQYQCVS